MTSVVIIRKSTLSLSPVLDKKRGQTEKKGKNANKFRVCENFVMKFTWILFRPNKSFYVSLPGAFSIRFVTRDRGELVVRKWLMVPRLNLGSLLKQITIV